MARTNQELRSIVAIRILQIVILCVLLIFTGRLAQLQILEYDKYRPISLANSIRQELVAPARGLVFDRSGRLLVDNRPIYTITVTPANFSPDIIPVLSEYLGLSPEEIEERVLAARRQSWHRPSRLAADVSFQTFSRIQENIWRLPSVGHLVESKRNYSSDINAAHVLGYMSEVTRQEYQRSARYQMGDKAGRSGIEQRYEPYLRGEKGARYVRVNALGQTLGPFQDEPREVRPIKGANIFTHIDASLQHLAEDLMENKTGAVVAMDPNTGAILTLVSSPTYDLERLAGRIDQDYWIALQSDTTNPLFNRAISTMQPPGSTIKPLMGIVGLDFGIITPETEITCRGGFTLGRHYRCTREHGRQNLEQAIKNSCNTYFFWLMNQTMNRVGLNAWQDRVGSFGLGDMSQIDLPHERRGIVPDSAYYNHHFGARNWGIGDLISVGVGQGTFSSSPLQMALLASHIANGGYRVRPHIVDRIEYPDGSFQVIEPEKERIPWVRQDHLEVIQKGMRKAVSEGSGRFYANISGVEVAGKTGTAQNPHGIDHGWFISYAPFDNPEIAIAVLVENAGFGSVSAAPIAGLMMEQFFHGRIRRNWVYQYVKDFTPREDQEVTL